MNSFVPVDRKTYGMVGLEFCSDISRILRMPAANICPSSANLSSVVIVLGSGPSVVHRDFGQGAG